MSVEKIYVAGHRGMVGSAILSQLLAQAIAQTIGFTGQIEFDTSKPDVSPRKWMYSSRLNEGLAVSYQNFLYS